ncbi:auxin-responsive protein SAUR32-like [Canna indica]|uniref:Auxin-responsive protein SAUR32-like n=1 Tax=Canna indica TaxID=4628 RepID=A0AAQ3QL90_9LILI|nr:auxin-responsive protein SAUR32-like [Canna indica]
MKAKKGSLTVRVGLEEEDGEDAGSGFRKFVVPISYLYHPLFRRLLEAAQEVYGYHSSGPLKLPCSVDDFLHLRWLIERESSSHHSHAGVNLFVSLSPSHNFKINVTSKQSEVRSFGDEPSPSPPSLGPSSPPAPPLSPLEGSVLSRDPLAIAGEDEWIQVSQHRRASALLLVLPLLSLRAEVTIAGFSRLTFLARRTGRVIEVALPGMPGALEGLRFQWHGSLGHLAPAALLLIMALRRPLMVPLRSLAR